MAIETITENRRHECMICVEEQIVIPYLSSNFTGFSQTPPVFLAAFLVAMVESACEELLKSRFGSNQRSTGAAVSLHIQAPVLVGVALRTMVNLVSTDGNRLGFDFVCRDDVAIVAQGQHARDLVG